MTLSRSMQKRIRALALKKYRDAEGLFVAEGHKVVEELLPSFPCRFAVFTPAFGAGAVWPHDTDVQMVEHGELERLSLLKSPQQVLAVFEKHAKSGPWTDSTPSDIACSQLVLALDCVQDPGNLGTIVRIADWYGIRHIFCSLDTADVFAPKTVQATMGSLGRVAVHYVDLSQWLSGRPAEVPVYGTFLDGTPIVSTSLTPYGVVVMGNEGRGIRDEVARYVSNRLFIPRYPADNDHPESLNVAVSTAVICQEFRRN